MRNDGFGRTIGYIATAIASLGLLAGCAAGPEKKEWKSYAPRETIVYENGLLKLSESLEKTLSKCWIFDDFRIKKENK